MSKKSKPIIWGEIPEKLPHQVGDSHAHIDMIPDFIKPLSERNIAKGFPGLETPSIAQTIQNAAASGVETIVQCACELPEILRMGEIIDSYDSLIGAVAIHPNEAALHSKINEVAPDGLNPRIEEHHKIKLSDALQQVYDTAANNPKIRAIGETGLDFFRTSAAGIPAQIESFKAHIKMANELGIALQIHDRLAHREIVETIDSEKSPNSVILHSFSGDKEFAEMCSQRGYFLSFSGVITFKSSNELREALKATPLNQILVETDTPFLTPEPYRGMPNSPYLTALTVQAISQILEIDLLELCIQLDLNFRSAFGI